MAQADCAPNTIMGSFNASVGRLNRLNPFRSRHFKTPKYARGTLFVHKIQRYLAVVVDADRWCRKDDAWRSSNREMLAQLEHETEQPWYPSVALGACGMRYAAEEDVDVLTDRPRNEIPMHVQDPVRQLVAAPCKASVWLDVCAHGAGVRKVIVEAPDVLSEELEQVLLLGRYLERFDWDWWMFVPIPCRAEGGGIMEGVLDGLKLHGDESKSDQVDLEE